MWMRIQSAARHALHNLPCISCIADLALYMKALTPPCPRCTDGVCSKHIDGAQVQRAAYGGLIEISAVSQMLDSCPLWRMYQDWEQGGRYRKVSRIKWFYANDDMCSTKVFILHVWICTGMMLHIVVILDVGHYVHCVALFRSAKVRAYDDRAVLKHKNSLQQSLCPVVICPYVCSSELFFLAKPWSVPPSQQPWWKGLVFPQAKMAWSFSASSAGLCVYT